MNGKYLMKGKKFNMNSKVKKAILLIGLLVLIGGSAFYLKSQFTFGEVDKANSEVGESSTERTAEEIATDKKIMKQRETNFTTYEKDGIIGAGRRGTKRFHADSETYLTHNEVVSKYMLEHLDIYEKPTGKNWVFGLSIDWRFEDLLYQIPLEEKKGIAKGYDDKEIYIYEARKKDGTYDDLILLKNKDTGKWEIAYVGNYYDYRDSLK